MGKYDLNEKVPRYKINSEVGMNRIFTKTVCLLAVLLMTLAVISGSYAANAAETQQSLQNKIDNAREQIDENNEKKDDIEEDMSDLESQIEKSENEVQALEDEVAEANSELQQTAKELDESQDDLNDRLRTMYKSGSMGFIDVILSSENVSDFMSNFTLVQYIFKNDRNIVSDLKDRHEELDEMTKQLAAKQQELNEKQDALGEEYEALASAKKEVNADNAELKEQISQWQADSQAIADQINSIQQGGGGYQPPNGEVSTSGFTWPVPGYSRVSSEYGWRILNGQSDFHLGIDIPAPTGTPVVAAKDGKVIATGGQHWSYGNIVIIDHGNGVATAYAHNSSILVSDGQVVKRGQTIALAGNTGNSYGSHCHFEVRINGHTVNPRNYL